MSAVIKLEHINKQYKMGSEVFKALDDVNVHIMQNEYVAIIGPSGSGKSTLMNLLGCLDTPSSGEYYLKDKLVKSMTETELAHQRNESVGFIFQSFNLIPRATALENVMQPLVYRFIPSKQRKQQALEALKRVGLGDKGNHLSSQLSGGQRQRVAIARAFIGTPKILFADEPSANLDSKNGKMIESLLFDLNSQHGTTLILVTHDEGLAQKCEHIIQIEAGLLVKSEAEDVANVG